MTADAVGGVWGYSVDLAGGLRGRGIDVVLAVMGPAPTAAQRAQAAAAGVHLEHAAFSLEWMDDPWRDVDAAGDWLMALEERFGCDLVHLNGYAHARCGFRSPAIVVAHSCVLSWWQAVVGQLAPARFDRYAEAVRDGLAAAAHVVSPTRWMKGALERHYGATATPSSVISNARAPGAFRPGFKQPFVLGAGRVWDAAKNLAALSRASGEIAWPIKIAGPLVSPARGSEPSPLDGDGRRGAELLGPVSADDMTDLYASAAVYALPARYEPFGLTVLEAALSGCALVLGDIPSLRELWDGAAAFVAPDDDQALVRSLRDLIDRPEARLAMAARALARAACYRRDDMVDAYLRTYAQAGAAKATGAQVSGTARNQERTCAS
jgi:glycosyltransferase involved in cell wall biosynthesis